MKREVYMYGARGEQYGIWNTVKKCWQFGICEDTPMLAEARLFQKIGEDARKYRFEARCLPPEMRQTIPEPAIMTELARKDREIKRLNHSLRHGQWVKPVPGDGENYCSVCKAPQPWFYGNGYQEYDFCPYCGAKMDKEEGQ